MPSVNCAVIGCTNIQYKFQNWKKELCDIMEVEIMVIYTKMSSRNYVDENDHFIFTVFPVLKTTTSKDRIGLDF